ncbi:MAG: ROK family protein [Candidatus Omnitrophica bacterium]|nr:ROK family protein [Candidatus Omnitrophota bacterium]MDD4012951.1 ROK family protein [Candidatus Omnitrophota bacterium]
MRDFVIKEEKLNEKERRNLEILDCVRRGGEISRAEISKVTDLNIVTVSNYVSKYIRSRVVFETGLDISTGGRRPELLKLNSEYGYSMGIDLGSPHLTLGASVVAVIMDLSGKVIARDKFSKENEPFDKLTDKVVDMSERLLKKSGIPKDSLKGTGVGIWGVLDRYKGMVRYAIENEKIVSYTTLLSRLQEVLGAPTLIEHDATLAAFGERWSGLGASAASENLIFMCSDSSCGLVIKGDLYFGSSKSAGELNLNPPYPGESSSKDKCWASYDYGCCMRSRGLDLGMPDKVRSRISNDSSAGAVILKLAGGDASKIRFETIIDAASMGDPMATEVLEEGGEYLGTKIAFLVNLFNPEVVVIGRGVERAGDVFFSAVRRAVKKWAYDESLKIAKIIPTSLGEDVVAIGAGGLVIQSVFAKV